MSEANKAASRAFFELYSDPDPDAVDRTMAVFSPAFRAYGYPVGPVDLDGMRAVGEMYKAAFPDVRAEIVEQLCDGDRVVNWVIWRGTHLGELQGIPPSGKTMEIPAIEIDRIVDGKIVEKYASSDNMLLMMQIGAIPAPAAV